MEPDTSPAPLDASPKSYGTFSTAQPLSDFPQSFQQLGHRLASLNATFFILLTNHRVFRGGPTAEDGDIVYMAHYGRIQISAWQDFDHTHHDVLLNQVCEGAASEGR